MARRKRSRPVSELPIAPMIDVVFLLLIYFMVSATIQKQEADLGFMLPTAVAQDQPLPMPDEVVAEVRADGQATVNGSLYDAPGSQRYLELETLLRKLKAASVANLTEPKLAIAPADEAPHEAIVKVMDACAAAGISDVSFVIDR